MVNEHTEYSGEVNVPVEAIQNIDPNVVASEPYFFLISSTAFNLSYRKKVILLAICQIAYPLCHRAARRSSSDTDHDS
jgi:hypothetical protein